MSSSANPLVAKRFEGPKVVQFSVFLRNKVGALLDVTRMLNEQHADVLALSIVDATDSSVVRMLVSDPDRVEEVFRANDVAFSTTEMLVVEMTEVGRDLLRLLAGLLQAEVNILYSYPLLTRPHDRSALALHVDDVECAASVLAGEGFRILSQADIAR